MAKCFIDDTTLTNIGNAIRSVNGSSDLMLPSAMPDAISLLNSGLYVWKKLTAEGGDFIDFVVSYSETAYPDGAVYTDGYWYEKFDSSTLIPENIREGIDIWGVIGTMVEGRAGVDFGEVTLASGATAVTVAHSLGAIPSWVAFIPKGTIANGNSASTYYNFNGKIYYSEYTTTSSKPPTTVLKSAYADVDNTLTESEIKFKAYSSISAFAAKDYYWFALA